jgi:predicted regulator of Ras-like GTPase activity (Roadblock/LC7/MglB family)
LALAEAVEVARASVAGARGLWLVSSDGVVVAGSGDAPDLPEDLLAATYSDLFRRAATAADEAELGAPAEMTLTSESFLIVLRAVGDDHALLAVAGRDALAGRVRHQLRLAASRLEGQL